MSMLRTRWAAVGAAVAVTLGAGGVSLSQAAIGSGDKPVFVPIEPCRLIDTRPANQIGPKSTPLGPNETLTLTVTGSTGQCADIPTNATGAAMNMTAIQPTAQSFLTVYPSDADRPNASNLNWAAGDPPTPNKVDVKLGADGAVKVFNSVGTVHLAADLVGYYIDHHHDDRYYTESESDARFLGASQDTHAAFDATSANQALTTIDTVFASVTVDTPTSGYVILNTGGYAFASEGFGILVRCSITTGTTVDTTFSVNVDVPADLRDGIGTTRTFVIDKALPPDSPTATYNFVCDTFLGSGQVHDVQLNATFIPDPDALESS